MAGLESSYMCRILNCGFGYQVSFIGREYIQSSFFWAAYVGLIPSRPANAELPFWDV